MPKITDLPTDTAPATTDLIPFVDVDAARTEAVTVANLAASTAFSGTYAPLASPTFTGNVVIPDADAATEAMNRQTSDARYVARSDAFIVTAPFLSPRSGSPVLTATGTPAVPVYLLDASASETVTGLFPVPSWAATVTMTHVWGNAGAGAGDVRIASAIYSVDIGASLNGGTVLDNQSTTQTAGASTVSASWTAHTSIALTAGAEMLRVSFTRDGAHVSDTLANDIGYAWSSVTFSP